LLLLLPFVSALLWALVLPISTWPLYRRHRDPASIAFVWQAIILETKP
jgi:hypothetical protein